ncbi:MAG: RND transporter [Gammaproteobacteria bacterium]|nr:RND transporter [Gammaproteobacteria bacterium]
MNLIDRFPLPSLVISAVLLGSAPFVPEPHLVEKLRMLVDGTLSRPLDIFDLVLHASLPILLIVRLIRMGMGLPREQDT